MYDPIIWDAAEEYGVPYEVARFLFKKESDFNPNAVSPKGAEGIGQIMPDTQKYLGVKNPFDPRENIFASVRYLKEGYDKYRNWGQAGGYYHSGPGSMNKVRGDINKLGPQGRQYATAFSKFDSPDYNPYYAPMDLQGRAQTPEVLPVSNPTPPPQIPETKKMDEYDKLAIFNPYVQMALGIMSGNSGATKGEAFANAMQGGLRANLASQEGARRASEDKMQNKIYQMKLNEYDRMRTSAERLKKFATGMAEKGGPMAPIYQLMSEMEPEQAIAVGKMYNDQLELAAKQGLYDIQANYYLEGRKNQMPSDVREAEWYRTATPEQQATYDKLRTKQNKPDVLTAPPKEWKQSINGMLEKDPDFKENRGTIGWFDDDNYSNAKRMLYLDSWELARRKGLTPIEAYQEAKKNYLPNKTIQAPQVQNTAPQAALDMLKSDPEKYKDAFKKKYGYLPEGY